VRKRERGPPSASAEILECSLICVQFDLLSHKHLLVPSGVLFSQLLTEHKNLAAVVIVGVAVLQTEALIDSVPE
jgi:hypothetical protein